METPLRTIVAYTDSIHKHSIPDLVLFINTDTKKLYFNKNGKTYLINLYYPTDIILEDNDVIGE